jgi:hypothetical protein
MRTYNYCIGRTLQVVIYLTTLMPFSVCGNGHLQLHVLFRTYLARGHVLDNVDAILCVRQRAFGRAGARSFRQLLNTRQI